MNITNFAKEYHEKMLPGCPPPLMATANYFYGQLKPQEN
jgi:hypothetical protein